MIALAKTCKFLFLVQDMMIEFHVVYIYILIVIVRFCSLAFVRSRT